MALPWDISASPIEASKLARLGVENGRVVLRAAFFRQFGSPYGADARADCPLRGHDAPQADCSCGFYAVTSDDELWRLGADEPGFALLHVELAGRVIEHDKGYRASHQRTREVQVHGTCTRCGTNAQVLHRRRFGILVPACTRCARRPMSLDEASASLGAPVKFAVGDGPPAPRLQRLKFVLAQVLPPVGLLVSAALLAIAWASALPLMLVQLGIVAWLVSIPWTFGRLAERLGIAPTEAARLRHRWSQAVAFVVIGCDFAVAMLALSHPPAA